MLQTPSYRNYPQPGRLICLIAAACSLTADQEYQRAFLCKSRQTRRDEGPSAGAALTGDGMWRNVSEKGEREERNPLKVMAHGSGASAEAAAERAKPRRQWM